MNIRKAQFVLALGYNLVGASLSEVQGVCTSIMFTKYSMYTVKSRQCIVQMLSYLAGMRVHHTENYQSSFTHSLSAKRIRKKRDEGLEYIDEQKMKS